MPYIRVTGGFNISAESWDFTMYLYTNVKTLKELEEYRSEIMSRVRKHINIYWGENFDALPDEARAYGFDIDDKIVLKDEAPKDVNRVEAYTEYKIVQAGKHRLGYRKDVLSNLQEDNWKGSYES